MDDEEIIQRITQAEIEFEEHNAQAQLWKSLIVELNEELKREREE